METIINKLREDINYMFYIKPKGAKRFSTYNPRQGTMGTGRVFTELYRKEHLLSVCKWIAEDNSGNFAYQLRSGDGKKIYWEHSPMIAPQATETPQISTETATVENISTEGESEPIKHISEIMETCRTWNTETRDYTDEYKYYTWLSNHQPGNDYPCVCAEMYLSEIRERITTAAKLTANNLPKQDIAAAVNVIVSRLATIENILQLYKPIEPPQSPKAQKTANCTPRIPEARETARKRPNRAIGRARHLNRSRLGTNGYAMLDSASATLAAMNVQCEYSTANSPPYWLPRPNHLHW